MITKDLLRRIRNDLPMPVVIAALGPDGPPSKRSFPSGELHPGDSVRGA